MKIGVLMATVALLFLFSCSVLAETKKKGDSPNLLLLTGVATGLSIVFLDEEIQKFSQQNKLGIEDHGTLVKHGFTAMLPIFAAVGYFGDNSKAKLTTRALIKSVASNTVVTALSKEVIGRTRPNSWRGAHEFNFFSGNRAMPSGHTSHSFTVATVLSEIYGEKHSWVPFVSYGAASFVAYSRIDGNKHWISDVIVGAVLGHFIGKWAVRTEEKKIKINPVLFDNGGVGLQAMLRF